MTLKIDAIEELRRVVDDDSLSMTARRDAAVHLVALKAKAVDLNVPDDDAEGVILRTPWPRTTESEIWDADSWSKVVNTSGWSLLDAKAEVRKRWALRALLAAVVDASLPHLERLETVRTIIAGLPDGHHYLRNSLSAEHMLGLATTEKDKRWYHGEGSSSGGFRQVSRPPLEYADAFR